MQQLRGIARKGKATRWNLADLLDCLDASWSANAADALDEPVG